MASVFFSYSHVDEDLRDQLDKQLWILTAAYANIVGVSNKANIF